MANDNSTTYDDFGGGMNTSDSELKIAPNQHTLIQNMLVDGSELKPIWGRETMCSTAVGGTWDAVYDNTVRIGNADYTHRIAIRNNQVWIESETLKTFQPLYLASDDPTFVSTPAAWNGSIVDYNGYLYITGLGRSVVSGSERGHCPIVWNGKATRSRTGTVLSASKTLVTLSSADSAAAKGDRICITDGTNAEMRTIVHIDSVSVYVDTAFTNAYASGSTVTIAKIHYVGIEAPTITLAGVKATGAGLEIGDYSYKIVYKNSSRNVTSDASNVITVTTTAGDQQVTLSGWAAEPVDSLTEKYGHYQIDQIQIWRTLVGASTYYLVGTINRDQGSSPNTFKFALTYTDSTSDATLSGAGAVVWSTRANENHTPAPELDFLTVFNDRLWGVRTFSKGQVRASSNRIVEYWPVAEVQAADPTSVTTSFGTYFNIGSAGNRVMALVPESGTFASTGRLGANLLVLTKNFAKRIYGYDLSDFRVDEAFAAGCVATRSAVNCGGMTIWASRNGYMAVNSGGNRPIIISKPIRNTIKSYGNVNGETAWESACSVYWQDYYITTAPLADGTMTGWCCYIGDDGTDRAKFTWTQCSVNMDTKWYHVSTKANNSGDYGGANDLIYCDLSTSSTIWRVAPWLRVLGTGVSIPIAWRKNIGRLGEPKQDCAEWTLRKVSFIVQTDATSDIALTLKVWRLGDKPTDVPASDPGSIYTQTLVCNGVNYHNAPRTVEFVVEDKCRWPMIELSASVTSDFRVKSVLIQHTNHGK